MTKVTIILTSYNHEKYLQEAIDSVLNQTFSNFELIIWDDASTDSSWEVIESYTDPRIKAFRNDENRRAVFGINQTIREIAKGEYIAIHHSDDIWEPRKLEKQVDFLDANMRIGAVFSDAHIIDEDGEPFEEKNHFYYNIFSQPNRSRYEWLNYFYSNGNALCHPSVLIRKDCYENCGLYRYGLGQLTDFDMWVRLCLKYEIYVMPEKLVQFRIRSNETNTSGNRPEARIRWQFEYLQILENYKKVSTLGELKKIFPIAEKIEPEDSGDIGFVLGMVALQTKPNKLAELFGLTVLFNVMSDPSRAKYIKEHYGFSHNDLVSLTAEHDVFSIGNIENLSRLLTEKEETIRSQTGIIQSQTETNRLLKSELFEIKRGITWKIYKLLVRARLGLIPPGSRRERFVHLLMRSGQVFRLEGHRSFFSRINQKMKQLGRRLSARISTASPQKSVQALAGAMDQENEIYVPIREADVDPENTLAKIIAFYLPQFHPIPENDEWWGNGFTEWTNVSKAVPNFSGHYQPHLPGELGFYDLRLPEVQKRQVELAKKYGIYGFCFYYYWFAGKRLLERPLDQYLANPQLDLPFCLCWANENWTRRWDGAEHEILIAQQYTEEQYIHFIHDLIPYFSDPRYIRIDGKPVLLVYRVNLLPDPQKAAEIWRTECRMRGAGEIFLAVVQSFGITDPRPYGFDGAVEFPPSHLGEAEINRKAVKVINPDFDGRIFDYNIAARVMMEKKHEGYTLFKTVMPSWDNTARKQNYSHIFINSSPSAYKAWLEKAVAYTQKSLPEDKRFIFVNAWNEWAEGTHLEPDRFHGYAYLQATADAVTKSPSSATWTILFVSHDANKGGAQDVLINLVSWFKHHTNINIKVLCLQGGEWLHRFKEVADTVVLNQLGSSENEDEIIEKILSFCEGTPDLIYGNTVVAGSAYTWLSKLNAPVLTHFHELETSIRKYGSAWIQDVIEYSSHFIACSHAVGNNLVQSYGILPENISTIYASIVSKQSKILDEKAKKLKRKNLGIEQEKLIIFGCGIGMPFRKGADIFIELAEILLQKRFTNFHLYWIGEFDPAYKDDTHGSWRTHYSKLKSRQLNQYVTFLGGKENPREYLSCGDIFVLPSREDPFPLVALEAADCGLPIICFDKAGGMPDFVGDDAGYVVPFEDVESMAQTVITITRDKALRHKLGERAREKLLDNFTVDKTSPYILSVARQVASKKPAVSVIVPNYNHEPFLEQRLESIFGQTFRDFEVILLDDASTDNSMSILSNYARYPDVQVVCNERNSGSPFKQWLKGIESARADILWIAESDDICAPNFLEALLPVFEDPQVKLAYSNSHIINEKDEIIGDYIATEYLSSLSKEKWSKDYKISSEQEINDGLGVKNTILNMSAVLVRRPVIDADFHEVLSDMRIAGDWYFIVNAIKNGLVVYDSRKLNSHRRHSKSVIAKTIHESKIRDFFREFYIVQDYIVNTYPLRKEFLSKWEDYLKKQWGDFTKGRPFDEISVYYPFEQMRDAIKKNVGVGNVG